MVLLLVATLLGQSGIPELEKMRVWLEGHRGELDLSGKEPILKFQVLAHNELSVAVESLEVGLLFAKNKEQLRGADPGTLYQPDTKTPGIGVVTWRAAVEVAPGKEAVISVRAPLEPGDPEPIIFVAHVLGYRLKEFSPALLFELPRSQVPADEVAAVETLALTGTPREKWKVRIRWSAKPGLIDAMIEKATAPVPKKPGLDEVIERVYAIRALGVLGGTKATETLQGLLKNPMLEPLDDPLQILGISRMSGTRLEVPMAYVVPPQARRMNDVIAAALSDTVIKEPPEEPEVTETGGAAQPTQSLRDFIVAVVAVGVLSLLLFLVWRRRG